MFWVWVNSRCAATSTWYSRWATYRDAADQCSLSRIWGGIHPPMDDMPGRLMGEVIGVKAVDVAEQFFVGSVD